MAEDSHALPLAPPHIYRRSDEEWAAPSKTHSQKDIAHRFHFRKPSRNSKCFVYFFTLIVLLCLASLVFALIVLRIDYPKLKLEAVQVKNLSYGFGNNNLASLNVTMLAEIKLSNNNFGGFKFRNGSTSVLYGNTTLGTKNINGGLVRGRKAESINVVVELKSDDDLGRNMNFSSDIGSKLVKLKSYAELRGKVRVMKFVTKHKTSFMNCSMSLNLTSQAIQDLKCL